MKHLSTLMLSVLSLLLLAVPPAMGQESTPEGWDAYEPNDAWEQAALIGSGQTVGGLTLHAGDADWFKVWFKAGWTYRVEAVAVGGGDPLLRLYDSALTQLGEAYDVGPGNSSASIQYMSTGDDFFYVEVASQVAGLFCTYELRVLEELPTPTPTVTPAPTTTPTATPVGPTLTPQGWDAYEPNDDASSAVLLGAGQTLGDLTLPTGDADWFKVWLKRDRTYRIQAATIGGGDPRMALYNATLGLIDESDDGAPGDPSPAIHYTPDADEFFYVEVTSQVAGLFCTYEMRALEELPVPTPTPKPTSTPVPTPTPHDAFEPNGDFDRAAEIAMGYTVQAAIVPGDNDFYKLYVEHDVQYRCDVTSKGNLDTNLIVYDANHSGIGGNNNRAPGDPGSSFTWVSAYQGWAYLLVGPVAGDGAYTLLCVAVTPTPTPALSGPALAPGGGEAGVTPTRILIPTPSPAVWDRSDEGVPTTPSSWNQPDMPVSTLAPPIRVVVYYDENDNGYSDPTEGIVGAAVILLDGSTNKPVTWDETDDTGFVQFTSPTGTGLGHALRISVPFLGFSKPVSAGQSVEVKIRPQRLPGLIP